MWNGNAETRQAAQHMTGGKLNETARRQQEARKKRLAEALRANMALRKKRAKPDTDFGPLHSDQADAASAKEEKE